ncbi:acyltransferase family protein [Sphingobium estronivorans]|uniref:acyltransferase family protein n=1 Tax=Sphingobium estronivorans TaxID=1577690 RepID=UPI00123A36E9|nr:acyltransferase [Sphingobium estronivorans]
MTINDELLKPERNNLTLVRLVLASAVILTHCYWQVHRVMGKDPFSDWLGVPLSVYAVDGFFFLSGFLVYGSLRRQTDVRRFMMSRLARMMPALCVSVLLTVAVGALFTAAPLTAYFGGETARFAAYNLALQGGHYSLTGIICGDAPCVVNGSLWTLRFEFLCYLALALLGLTGLARPRLVLTLVAPVTLAGALIVHVPAVAALVHAMGGKGGVYWVESIDRLWTLFAAGMVAEILRHRIRLSWLLLVLLGLANVAAYRWNLNVHVQTLFVGYAVLCGGFLTSRHGAISGRWPDYSYGMYIYAFPVMVLLAGVLRTDDYRLLALASFVGTLPLAALSWHFVEKPVLDKARARRKKAAAKPQPAFGTI